ncbi:MAG TPA: zinc-binding alcohol dehydrogenase family protein [Acetobacteraceae bacterium]|jgi:NADPH2:quinone reductase|nr:zinc-binding alcohol dehydrogenase family protein [Acetobacteraceae bacterium]
MSHLRVLRPAATIDELDLRVEPQPLLPRGPDDVLVEVHYAAVNPSDAKATLGAMAHALWPRTPGRDWAGIVREGPSELIGDEVFGSAGDLGITRDGTHASHLVLPHDALVPRPAALTLAEAGALGVPFVTAQEGFRRAGVPRPGEVVLVMGGNGRVGQAAVQIAAMHGASVFAVTRGHAPYDGHASAPIRTIDAADDVAVVVRTATDGHGADIVYNTVGSPYFGAANQAMAPGGRQILISTLAREVPFNIFAFYRGRHTYVGIDSLALDSRASAAVLRELLPGFSSGQLRPFEVRDAACYPLGEAAAAYRAVLAGARDRIVLRME